jgi:hypothetical protein
VRQDGDSDFPCTPELCVNTFPDTCLRSFLHHLKDQRRFISISGM